MYQTFAVPRKGIVIVFVLIKALNGYKGTLRKQSVVLTLFCIVDIAPLFLRMILR